MRWNSTIEAESSFSYSENQPLKWKWKGVAKLLSKWCCKSLLKPLDHIIFNCYKLRYNSYHANECAEVEHGKKSLDYHPLMYAINQCEATHLWWQWALKYLSASWHVRMDVLESSHLQDLSIKKHWLIPMINKKKICHWFMQIPGHYKTLISTPANVSDSMGQDHWKVDLNEFHIIQYEYKINDGEES